VGNITISITNSETYQIEKRNTLDDVTVFTKKAMVLSVYGHLTIIHLHVNIYRNTAYTTRHDLPIHHKTLTQDSFCQA